MEIDREAILQMYLAESEEQLGQMEEALVALETHPDDEEILDTIFRGAHTIKGNASSLGFPQVSEFAHAIEELLQHFRNRTIPVTKKRITLLLRSVDALRQMVPDAVAGGEELPPEHAELLKQLTDKKPVAAEEKEPSARKREEVQGGADRARTLRVDIQKLDRMLNLSSEITVAQGRLRQIMEEMAGQLGEEVLEAKAVVEKLWLTLQEEIMKIRMVPVGPTFRQYIRTVRDIAQAHGKVARLVIEGAEVEVDTKVIEHLRDPLTHMIRNAVDHGIESPEARQARGKDPCGCITLRSFQDAGSIIIQVADDGVGLNRQKILTKALARGMIAEAQTLSQEETYRLVFEPGFSTAETVTELSGRGVGMDVVRRNIEALRGSVAIDSREGEGTTVTIRLPLTLAIIDGLKVGVGGETFVIPLDTVLECLDLPEEGRRQTDGQGLINLRGKALPYVRLRDVFALGGSSPARENVVVVRHDGMQVGFAVDIVYGESQSVIKPLGKFFQGLPGVAGSTILGNGRVALILDVPTLIQQMAGQEAQVQSL